jgi:hypothetical protein
MIYITLTFGHKHFVKSTGVNHPYTYTCTRIDDYSPSFKRIERLIAKPEYITLVDIADGSIKIDRRPA